MCHAPQMLDLYAQNECLKSTVPCFLHMRETESVERSKSTDTYHEQKQHSILRHLQLKSRAAHELKPHLDIYIYIYNFHQGFIPENVAIGLARKCWIYTQNRSAEQGSWFRIRPDY